MTALQNKTVVITAGNRGSGLALSQKYVANGANVVMIADKHGARCADVRNMSKQITEYKRVLSQFINNKF